MLELRGSFVALVTPMEEDGSISWQHLYDLIDWHVDSGTAGIVVVGTTGESATIDVSEHVQMIEQSVDHANSRIPIIAGTGANSTKEAIYLTKAAKKVGASAALLVTPYYNRPTQEGLTQHYSEIASEVDLPQILYNVPSRTGCDLLPETVARLAKQNNIIGLKESVSSLDRLDLLKRELDAIPILDDFFLLSGDDQSSAQFLNNGGHGTISVTANLIPEKISKICNLIFSDSKEEALKIDAEISSLHEVLFIESSPIPVKWALNRLGRIPPGIRLPLTPLKKEYHSKVENILNYLGLVS